MKVSYASSMQPKQQKFPPYRLCETCGKQAPIWLSGGDRVMVKGYHCNRCKTFYEFIKPEEIELKLQGEVKPEESKLTISEKVPEVVAPEIEVAVQKPKGLFNRLKSLLS